MLTGADMLCSGSRAKCASSATTSSSSTENIPVSEMMLRRAGRQTGGQVRARKSSPTPHGLEQKSEAPQMHATCGVFRPYRKKRGGEVDTASAAKTSAFMALFSHVRSSSQSQSSSSSSSSPALAPLWWISCAATAYMDVFMGTSGQDRRKRNTHIGENEIRDS